MIEIDDLGKHPEQTLTFISDVSREAGGRISTRITIGIPVLNEEGLENVLSFMPMAKEGFALNLRASDVEKDEIADLIKITRPQSWADFASDLGFKMRHYVIKDDPRLSLFRHSMAVLSLLSSFSTVDSFRLDVVIPGASHWPYKLDTEDIWNLLSEVEDSTRKIVLDKTSIVGTEATMRALHFFIAGQSLAEKLK